MTKVYKMHCKNSIIICKIIFLHGKLNTNCEIKSLDPQCFSEKYKLKPWEIKNIKYISLF